MNYTLFGFVVLYLLGTLALGIYAGTRVKNTTDFAVAGRGLPLAMVITTTFATWFGAETVMGLPAKFIQGGLGAVVEDPFGASFCLILSMYGGGFAAIPAYLADMFGTQFVGAIHGRLLTAWSTAGILGPVVVNYMRDYQLSLGLPRSQVYNQTMFILVGMLAVGLIANLLIRPVHDKHFMTPEELAHEKQLASEKAHANELHGNAAPTHVNPVFVWLAWAAVGIPLAWGIYRTILSVSKFFN